ncbi:ATP-binding protein [Actinocorallia aurantiaca]|uniref:Nuclease SbcCD subunit C n=1 Tax=Actinocorallia aurantiaca TaxID=46204 RepID=A0ABP6GXD9_9ACTN
MSALSAEVVNVLAKRRAGGPLSLTVDEVDKILSELGVPLRGTKAVPVPLRATRIHFRGTKWLKPDHPDAAGHRLVDAADLPEWVRPVADKNSPAVGSVGAGAAPEVDEQPGPKAQVPFQFEWSPQPGVNGIGSGRNLRGKSTILNVLMWSLTGRCPQFQNDVRSWIEHVEVDWQVGTEQLRVGFDAVDGVATGQVVSVTEVDSDTRSTVIGQFIGADFEGVMGSLMMARLRLENIPVWTDATARVHAWPAYSSSFVVRANQLDPIVGNEQTIGVRMMQMFIGTDWAPVQAAAMTARRGMDTARATAKDKAQAAGEVVEASRSAAEKHLQDLRAKLGKLPAATLDVQGMFDAAARASDLARQIHRLEVRLIEQASFAETARQQLKAVKARVHTKYEDALAARFFHHMRPSVCPRCAAQVTPERQAAEPDKHECSVCASELNLEALQSDVIVAASVPDQLVGDLVTGTSGGNGEDGNAEEGPVDEVGAAQTAVSAAEAAVAKLTGKIAELTRERGELAARVEVGGELLTAASERRTLELDLARAEGALGALTRSSDPRTVDPVDPVQLAVVEAAEQVLKKWVKNDQDPMLVQISADIERLTQSFGADNLSAFALSGAASMALRENGVKQIYSGLTAGEKLRVKIATAIALIRHGYVEGIGRHPGFLVLDSPSAEEMPEEDLATMVKALKGVAGEAEMQIFVATRNAAPLVELLPEANRVVAEGNSYVW